MSLPQLVVVSFSGVSPNQHVLTSDCPFYVFTLSILCICHVHFIYLLYPFYVFSMSILCICYALVVSVAYCLCNILNVFIASPLILLYDNVSSFSFFSLLGILIVKTWYLSCCSFLYILNSFLNYPFLKVPILNYHSLSSFSIRLCTVKGKFQQIFKWYNATIKFLLNQNCFDKILFRCRFSALLKYFYILSSWLVFLFKISLFLLCFQYHRHNYPKYVIVIIYRQ